MGVGTAGSRDEPDPDMELSFPCAKVVFGVELGRHEVVPARWDSPVYKRT
jgi:hypothetical protein